MQAFLQSSLSLQIAKVLTASSGSSLIDPFSLTNRSVYLMEKNFRLVV